MESELLKEWTAEERKEGRKSYERSDRENYLVHYRTNIHDLLEIKFNIVSEHISAKLQKIQDSGSFEIFIKNNH